MLRYVFRSGGERSECFGKVFGDGPAEPLVAGLAALHRHLLAEGGPWDIPAPLGSFPEAGMLVLEGLPEGVDLRASLDASLNDPGIRRSLGEQITRIAQGLVPFQRAVIPHLPQVAPRALLNGLARQVDVIEGVAPSLARSIRAVLATLEAETGRRPAEAMVPSHGAFRLSQFLAQGTRLRIVDLDNLCLAGASADAGEFLASLDRTGLTRPCLRPVADHCADLFAATLERQPGLSFAWLAWYRALGHLKWAIQAVRSLAPGWPDLGADLVRQAKRTLETATLAGTGSLAMLRPDPSCRSSTWPGRPMTLPPS